MISRRELAKYGAATALLGLAPLGATLDARTASADNPRLIDFAERRIAPNDITAAGYNCFDRYPIPGPRSLIYPCHSVSLGFAFPAAIGAKLAAPERPVVSLSGDGGFVMG